MTTCRPNRSTGTRTRIALQEETCWGEKATGQIPYGLDFASETLQNSINAIDSELIRSDRMMHKPSQGNHNPGGDITGELQPHGPWPLIMKHLLGGSVVTSGSSPYVHALQGNVELPESLTIEKRFGFPDGTFKYLRYLGSRVNEVEIGVPREGNVTARVNVLSQQEKEEEDAMHASPSFPTNNNPFNTFHGTILLDRAGDGTREAIATITEWNLTVNNGISPDEFAIDGNKYRADLPEDLRTVRGRMTAFFTSNNWVLYQSFLANTTLSMELTLTRGAYSWHFTIPAFTVRGNPTPQVQGRGPLNIPIEWMGHRDEDLGTDILLTITNADPVISTAA
jgi:hypothetical protein